MHSENKRHVWHKAKVLFLTDARQQIIEPLFGEKRVLQTTEVKFENAGHRVDVMIVIIVRQGVIS